MLFEIAKESQVFVQRFDDIWMEKVDIDLLDEVHDHDKLFLVCKELNSKTMEKVWHSYKTRPSCLYELIRRVYRLILSENNL